MPGDSKADSKVDFEKQVIAAHVGHIENTHKLEVSSSVGIALLLLKKNYFSETPDEKKIAAEIELCFQQLRNASNGNTQQLAAVEDIIRKTARDSTKLDVVKLWRRKTIADAKDTKATAENELTDEDHLFEMKFVLTLVWKAINDNTKYLHNYKGTTAEKLAASEQDREKRRETFFTTLNNMKHTPVCSHGDRNELTFTLNHVYEGIDILEDTLSSVLATLKDKIYQKFVTEDSRASSVNKDEKTANNHKTTLNNALFEWMEKNDASKMLKLVDEKNVIITQIHELFISHGINPEVIKLNDIIQNAIIHLAFPGSEQKNKALFYVNYILNIHNEDLAPNRKQALKSIIEWLKRQDDLTAENNLTTIKIFYFVFIIDLELDKNRSLLVLNQNMQADFDEVQKYCDNFFERYKDNTNLALLSQEMIDKVVKVKEIFDHLKASKMMDTIESFFANWYSLIKDSNNAALQQERVHQQLAFMYTMFLSDSFKEKVLLTDADIKIFFSASKKFTDEVSLSPYIINRLFLHAILTPSAWSLEFSQALRKVLAFVEGRFNNTYNPKLAEALGKGSYPKELIDQIKYLISKYAVAEDTKLTDEKNVAIERPLGMILIPEECKNYAGWLFIATHVNTQQWKRIYAINSMTINRIFTDKLQQYIADDFDPNNVRMSEVLKIMRYLDERTQINWIKILLIEKKNNSEWVKYFLTLLEQLFPTRCSTEFKIGFKNWFDDIPNANKFSIVSNLSLLRKVLVNLELEIEASILKGLQYKQILFVFNAAHILYDKGLNVLSIEQYIDQFSIIRQHNVSDDLVVNEVDFTTIYQQLYTNKNISAYLKLLKPEVLPCVVINYFDLFQVLPIIPENDRLNFLQGFIDRGQLIQFEVGDGEAYKFLVKNIAVLTAEEAKKLLKILFRDYDEKTNDILFALLAVFPQLTAERLVRDEKIPADEKSLSINYLDEKHAPVTNSAARSNNTLPTDLQVIFDKLITALPKYILHYNIRNWDDFAKLLKDATHQNKITLIKQLGLPKILSYKDNLFDWSVDIGGEQTLDILLALEECEFLIKFIEFKKTTNYIRLHNIPKSEKTYQFFVSLQPEVFKLFVASNSEFIELLKVIPEKYLKQYLESLSADLLSLVCKNFIDVADVLSNIRDIACKQIILQKLSFLDSVAKADLLRIGQRPLGNNGENATGEQRNVDEDNYKYPHDVYAAVYYTDENLALESISFDKLLHQLDAKNLNAGYSVCYFKSIAAASYYIENVRHRSVLIKLNHLSASNANDHTLQLIGKLRASSIRYYAIPYHCKFNEGKGGLKDKIAELKAELNKLENGSSTPLAIFSIAEIVVYINDLTKEYNDFIDEQIEIDRDKFINDKNNALEIIRNTITAVFTDKDDHIKYLSENCSKIFRAEYEETDASCSPNDILKFHIKDANLAKPLVVFLRRYDLVIRMQNMLIYGGHSAYDCLTKLSGILNEKTPECPYAYFDLKKPSAETTTNQDVIKSKSWFSQSHGEIFLQKIEVQLTSFKEIVAERHAIQFRYTKLTEVKPTDSKSSAVKTVTNAGDHSFYNTSLTAATNTSTGDIKDEKSAPQSKLVLRS